MPQTRTHREGSCSGCLPCIRRLLCCDPTVRRSSAPPPKVSREVDSFKKVVIFRHGQGRHQTDRVMTKGLGPCLTELGLKQAYAVRANKVFSEAIAVAERPVFAASNVVRAVETMCHAAPGRTIVVQPLLRERIIDEFDWPSRLDLLEQWLFEHHVEADLDPYRRELDRLAPAGEDVEDGGDGADPESPTAVEQRTFERYIRGLQEADGTNRLGGDTQESKERARQLVKWMGELDSDAIFLASHGAFLQHVNLMASQSWTGAAWATLTGSGYMQNCEVREYRLERQLEPVGWMLTDAADSRVASGMEVCSPPASAVDLPEGMYRIKLASAQQGQEAGWYLTARRTRAPDRRSPSSTFAIVHAPTAECYKGQWSLNRLRPGVYNIELCSRDQDQPSGWFLTARRSQKQDKRDGSTTFAIIHEPLEPSYMGCWQLLEGSRPGVYILCLAGYSGGVFLTAHRSRSMQGDQRSPESTYAIVVEGFDKDLVAEWELEISEHAGRSR